MGDIDMFQVDELIDLKGATVVGRDGEKIGKIEQIWVDTANALPEWALVKAGGLLGRHSRFVPLRAADFEQGEVKVAYTKDEVESAPDVDPDQVSRDDEVRLYQHYGQPRPAPPPPQVRNPFDRLSAVWVPGVGERAAAVGKHLRGGGE
ncbi:MAG: PRC-barrel domain-containing protein [Actinomycetota bacterium]|nr:PRC-barrel domain-containing protein [Actinomycetota bacterium]